jgi:TatD DNase family protein
MDSIAPAAALPFPDSTLRTPPSEFFILPAFGVHPWYCGNLPSAWLTLLAEFLARHPEAPVGEIGIDGLRDDVPRDAQRQALCAQLELATRLHRPVVLHGARAWGELLAIVKPFAPRLPGFVTHAFSGSADILREIVAMGGTLSFAGAVCNPAARRVRAAATAAPAERLLIETDAPDMLPQGLCSGFRVQAEDNGKIREINHPANLVLVARAVAELRGAPVEEIAALTTANARRVYGLQ